MALFNRDTVREERNKLKINEVPLSVNWQRYIDIQYILCKAISNHCLNECVTVLNQCVDTHTHTHTHTPTHTHPSSDC